MNGVPDAIRNQWQAEGYDLFVVNRGRGDEFELEAIDGDDRWGCDDEVIAHVLRRAMAGSLPHMLAIWLDGRCVERDWWPDLLADTEVTA